MDYLSSDVPAAMLGLVGSPIYSVNSTLLII